MSGSPPIDVGAAQSGAPAVAQLRSTLLLVEQLAGGAPSPAPRDAMLDDDALLATAYHDAPDVTRRRFDALAGEAAAYAAAGVEMLIGRSHNPVGRAAAAGCLARELRKSLGAMVRLVEGTRR